MALEDASARTNIPGDSLTNVQAQKLELEVRELQRKLRWDAKIGSIGSVVASVILVLGFIAGIIQYGDARKQEFKRRFWEKQLETYSEVASAAASLANLLPSDSAGQAEYDRFSRLYNGEFMLIADDTAFNAAREYVVRYIEYRADPRKQDRTKRQSRAMAKAFRYALAQNGDIQLASLTGTAADE